MSLLVALLVSTVSPPRLSTRTLGRPRRKFQDDASRLSSAELDLARRGFCCRGQSLADYDFNRAALHPAYPIKCRTSTQAPESVEIRKQLPP
jgi:hypothetical protein